MRRIAYLVAGFMVIMMLSLCSNPAPSKKTAQNLTKDSINHVVTLSIDDAPVKGKGPELFFYHHDSLVKTHGISVTSMNTNFPLNAPALLLEATEK